MKLRTEVAFGAIVPCSGLAAQAALADDGRSSGTLFEDVRILDPLVDRNPLENIQLVAAAARNLLVIMKDGVIYENLLR